MNLLRTFHTKSLLKASILLSVLMVFLSSNGVRCQQITNEIIQEEPHGPIDFSEAEVQSDGSLCVIKTKMVPKMEKQQVKECWHQNITQCHETYVTEFRPAQEQLCEENFWKACKITFRETAYNYTLKTCMTPLVKKCDEEPQSYGGYGAPQRQTQMVCKTWFESTCNTTYSETPGGSAKPQTWCSKEPRKICAPDNCRMEPGEEVCHDKTLESTVRKPEEVCDLQPQTQCRLVTNLVPHLETQVVCKEIPKEVCHLKLDHPKMVQKPVKLKWCTKAPQEEAVEEEEPKPTYLPSPPQYQSYERPEPQQLNNFNAPPSFPTQAPIFATSQPTSSPIYYRPNNVNNEPRRPHQPQLRFRRLSHKEFHNKRPLNLKLF